MSSKPPPSDDRETLAAEYALGLLEGEELAQAIERERNDPAFRDAVNRWTNRLAPMLDEVAPVAPPANALAAIERRIGTLAAPTDDTWLSVVKPSEPR